MIGVCLNKFMIWVSFCLSISRSWYLALEDIVCSRRYCLLFVWDIVQYVMNNFSFITYNTIYPKTRRCLMEFPFLFQSYIFLTFAKFAQKNVLIWYKIKTKQISDSKFVIQIIIELSWKVLAISKPCYT